MTLESLGEGMNLYLQFYSKKLQESVLLYLIENPGASQTEIATFVGCSAPTVV